MVLYADGRRSTTCSSPPSVVYRATDVVVVSLDMHPVSPRTNIFTCGHLCIVSLRWQEAACDRLQCKRNDRFCFRYTTCRTPKRWPLASHTTCVAKNEKLATFTPCRRICWAPKPADITSSSWLGLRKRYDRNMWKISTFGVLFVISGRDPWSTIRLLRRISHLVQQKIPALPIKRLSYHSTTDSASPSRQANGASHLCGK